MALPRDEPRPSMDGMRRRRLRARKGVGGLGGRLFDVVDAGSLRAQLQLLYRPTGSRCSGRRSSTIHDDFTCLVHGPTEGCNVERKSGDARSKLVAAEVGVGDKGICRARGPDVRSLSFFLATLANVWYNLRLEATHSLTRGSLVFLILYGTILGPIFTFPAGSPTTSPSRYVKFPLHNLKPFSYTATTWTTYASCGLAPSTLPAKDCRVKLH